MGHLAGIKRGKTIRKKKHFHSEPCTIRTEFFDLQNAVN